MKCPVCTGPDLVMSERSGIEIDYCPQCRGVWLDRGELDKIIERSAAGDTLRQAPGAQDPRAWDVSRHHEGHHGHDGHGHSRHGPKSLWRELFD